MIQPPDLLWPRRIIWGLAGIIWFFWIAYEDRGLLALTLVSTTIAVAAGATVLDWWTEGALLPRKTWLLRTGIVGGLAGAAIGPLSALLMLLKLGLHAHPQPDFTPEEFVTALSRTVYWAALGAVIGVALGLATKKAPP